MHAAPRLPLQKQGCQSAARAQSRQLAAGNPGRAHVQSAAPLTLVYYRAVQPEWAEGAAQILLAHGKTNGVPASGAHMTCVFGD